MAIVAWRSNAAASDIVSDPTDFLDPVFESENPLSSTIAVFHFA